MKTSRYRLVVVAIIAIMNVIFDVRSVKAQIQLDGGGSYRYTSGIIGDVELGKTISSTLTVSGTANVSGVFEDRGSTTNLISGNISYVGVNYYDLLFYGRTNTSATFNMTGGTAGTVSVFNAGVANQSGGNVTSGSAQGANGSIYRASGTAYIGILTALGGTVDVNGSGVFVPQLNVNSGVGSLENGTVGLVTVQSGVFNQSGGNIGDTRQTGGRINRSGGNVSTHTEYLYNNAVLNIISSSFEISAPTPGVDSQTGSSGNFFTISGKWGTDISFMNDIFISGSAARLEWNSMPISLPTGSAAPEPSALALALPLGVGFIIRRRKIATKK